MTTRLINHERLAWDSARVISRVLESDQVGRWLHEQMSTHLGPEVAEALVESRLRMWASARLDAPQIEAGIWRAKLEELLLGDPTLAMPLRVMITEADQRLEVATDKREFGTVPKPPPGPRVIDLDRYRPGAG